MRFLVATAVLALSASSLAAQPAAASKAPFSCAAQSGVCHFHIFYGERRGRIVLLPAGVKETIPDVRIGTDKYCMRVNKNPAHKCARKVINAISNS